MIAFAAFGISPWPQQSDSCVRLEALHEAGMPPGVVQFVPDVAEECGRVLTPSPDLAALHFTGSTDTFNHLWRSISTNISKYGFLDGMPFVPQSQPFANAAIFHALLAIVLIRESSAKLVANISTSFTRLRMRTVRRYRVCGAHLSTGVTVGETEPCL